MGVTAFIPARGGSRRLPNKNLAIFRDSPLIVNTVEQAVSSEIFDNIIVSTDSPEIKRVVSDYNIKIVDRSRGLSGDKAVLLDVVRNYITEEELKDSHIVAILLVTAPLREVYDIRNAYELFVSHGGENAVVSVCENENPIHLSWTLDDGHLSPVFPKEYSENISKSERMRTYYFNDAIVIDSAVNFKQPRRNLFGPTPTPYFMPPERSVYIDFDYQLKIAKFLAGLEE